MSIEQDLQALAKALSENNALLRQLIAAKGFTAAPATPSESAAPAIAPAEPDPFPSPAPVSGIPASLVRQAEEAQRAGQALTAEQQRAVVFKANVVKGLQAAFTAGKTAALQGVFGGFYCHGLKDFQGDYIELDGAMRKAGIYA